MKTKIIITALAFSLISAGPPGAPPIEYITINGHTYGFDRSQECQKNPACLRGSSVIAKEALVAATGQMDAATKETKTAEKKIGDHVNEVGKYVEDAGRVATSWTNFVVAKLNPHNEDALKQQAANMSAASAIDAFNGLPAEQQSTGEAARLNKELQATLDWAKIVDARVIRLTEEGGPILEEKFKLVKKQRELMEENTRLRNALMLARFKEGEAYRQLLKCVEYAKDIKEQLNKHSMQGSDMIELNDADAALRNRMSQMFGEGNNHTGSVLARPGSSVSTNYQPSTESYQVRAERLINALPPQQRTAVAAVTKPKTEPPAPTVDKSTSTGVIGRFRNWINKQ